MSDAYKVGITIALTNQVSRGLMLIQGDLAKTNAQAIRLKATLKEIKLLGIGGAILGGVGYAGLHALGKTVEAAKEYQQALAQFKSLNFGDSVNSQADKFARGASVIGASATDLMRTTRDLTTVLGDFGMAKQLAPGFAQLKFANQAVYGGHGLDFNEHQLRDLERIIEMKGGFKSPQDFLAQASMMQQVIAGTGGMVKPSDYLAFIKTAGVAGRLLDNKAFYYGMEPLIQELGGNRVGTGLMSAYNNLAQGRSTVRAATELMKLGLLDRSMVEFTKIGTIKQVRPGALKDNLGFGANPYQWMQDVLLPAMRARGITSEQGVLQELGVIFGNRTASSLFSLMFLQQEKIAKNMKLSQNAMGTDELVKLARSSPQGAEMALGKAWANLKMAAGEALIPIIIPALNKLAEVIRAIGQWAYRHPRLFDTLIYGFAGLSAALLFGGTVLTLKAAFLALKIAVPLLTTPLASMAALPLAGIASGLGLVTAALAALIPIVYHQQIAAWVDKHAPVIGDSLLAASDFLSGSKPSSSNRSFVPPPSGKTVQVSTAVNLDGRQIASVVSRHQADAANGPATSPSGFDGRMTPSYGGSGS
ncbi:hypothetical protein OJF2_50840 [Aquisphaera giovannonii]|uniref:Phage-related minor tail protein n=1 Tax=Aquisphaera giovannonii TaxID=406548 RepID=A0A5B9W9J6_9BACT|nr:hypothetical protein [Aquisphaera giovannonii]QEH36500.1 hypothetical protein OJF2_50840 [Aquisphaera giovannonii]